MFSVLVSENILKHDNTLLAQRQVDNLDLPNESKKRADFIRHPDTVAKAEKIATDWLSMIERVRIIFQSLSQLRNKFSVSFCAGKL
jgi:hypothetical protein